MKTEWIRHAGGFALTCLALAGGMPSQALTPAESTSLVYMKQEEKLARDVYRVLGERWSHPMFQRIATSEQRHMDALEGWIKRNGVPDPTPAAPGRFSIPDLQQLHDELVARGSRSLDDALQVGLIIEAADIQDLDEAISAMTDPGLQRVYGNLRRASEQHRLAFAAVLDGAASSGASVACTGEGCGARAGSGSGCAGKGMAQRPGGNRCAGVRACPESDTCPSGGSCAAESRGGPASTPSPITGSPRRRAGR